MNKEALEIEVLSKEIMGRCLLNCDLLLTLSLN
jgi:hypothetical protein